MAVVSTQLTSDFVPEGVRNLYFTNARADARVNALVQDFALQNDFGLVPTTRLPTTLLNGVSQLAYNDATRRLTLHYLLIDSDTETLESHQLPNWLTEAELNPLVSVWAHSGDTSLIPVAKLGSGTPSATTYLNGAGAWTTPAGGTGGLTQAEADLRYLQLTGGIIDAGNARALRLVADGSGPPAMQTLTNSTGAQKAWQALRAGGGTGWFSIEGMLGGSNEKPGLAMGPGSGGRDVELYREAANHLLTPDVFSASELRVTGSLATTQAQLGLETWARTGDSSLIPSSKLPPVATGEQITVVNTPGHVPAAGAGTIGDAYFVVQDESLRIGVDTPGTSSTPTGTFNAIPNRSDLHIVSSLPSTNDAVDGDFYYWNSSNIHGGGQNFYRVRTENSIRYMEQVHPSIALAASRSNSGYSVIWLGAEGTAGFALEFTYTLAASTDYFYLNTGSDTIRRLVRSSFQGAGTTSHHYRFLSPRPDLRGMTWADAA